MSLLTKDTIQGLNENPNTLLNGLEAAANLAMNKREEAMANNDERKVLELNKEIQDINKQIVSIKADMGDKQYLKDSRNEGGLLGDLDGNNKLNSYEQTRQNAIEKNMRNKKASGGLLDDDREQYVIGGIAARIARLMAKQKKIKKELDTEKMSKSNRAKAEKEINRLQKEIDAGTASESSAAIQGEMAQTANQLKQRGFSPERIDELLEEAFELRNYSELETALSKPILKAEGGDIEGQMTMLMMPNEPEEDMLPDDEMEDEYLDFILDEALDNEEEDYLMSQLQGNEQLSEIFDKVIDVAQEFAGSGPVEGPGSGVSDSIPARLSDGEFVFTAKAVEEIGADNLMAMMKDAEMKADGRQDLAEGGQPEEEETVEMPVEKPASRQDIRVVKTTVDNGGKGLLDEDEISKSIKSKMMLDNRTGRHVQS
jgi:hypothetical protein